MIDGSHPERRETELFAAIRAGAESFGDRRLLAIFVEMNLGGVESSRGLLGGGLTALLQHRDQWLRLVAQPELLPSAVDELLRVVSPGLWTTRLPREHVELRSVPIAPEDTVIAMVGAANRDPEVFAQPDALDIGRPNARQHLAFGHGPHYCLGQALARLELSVLLRTLIRRFPDIELTEAPITRSGGAQNPRIDRIEVRLGNDRG
jgi:cytochrome P450